MEVSSADQERVQHQYDALVKKLLKERAKSYVRMRSKHASNRVSISQLRVDEFAQISTVDEYESDHIRFRVLSFDVIVKNELLAGALNTLPKSKRDPVLLFYFLDMSDVEIGEQLNVVRTTIFRRRKAALEKIKRYLEKNNYEQ